MRFPGEWFRLIRTWGQSSSWAGCGCPLPCQGVSAYRTYRGRGCWLINFAGSAQVERTMSAKASSSEDFLHHYSNSARSLDLAGWCWSQAHQLVTMVTGPAPVQRCFPSWDVTFCGLLGLAKALRPSAKRSLPRSLSPGTLRFAHR